jgi:hypothetical protein
MIDPLTSLAFSVYSGKGVYALLLGSGISRAAKIPTSWEVTLDLIRQIAAVENKNCDPDPGDWYLKTYGKEADYSVLLESLALLPTERTNALRNYFEPTPAQRDAGEKSPTLAHRAIAKLVAKGFFHVIITTNFDRLMEQALETEGVNPTVISTADMVKGAIPLAHTDCTLVKVHGDYKDTRLRNTTSELSSYDKVMDKLLDQIFDEYGLMVCGWSGTWDTALRAAILRSRNRRYSFTWKSAGELTDEASKLITFRQGVRISIDSANAFFGSLADKLDSLEKFNAPHPLSTALAVASLKRFIVDDRFRIELYDLVTTETERQFANLKGISVQPNDNSCDYFKERLRTYENSMEMLMGLLANGCYWGGPSQSILWQRAIMRMVDLSPPQGGGELYLSLRRYPACILLYTAGVACVASGNYETLKILMRDQRTSIDSPFDGKDSLLISKLVAPYVLREDSLNRCANLEKKRYPTSVRLHGLLRETMRTFLPKDSDYDDAFDRFEFLFTLVYLELVPGVGTPIGLFGLNYLGIFPSSSLPIGEVLVSEQEAQGKDWGPLRSGLFKSSEEFRTAENKLSEYVKARASYF